MKTHQRHFEQSKKSQIQKITYCIFTAGKYWRSSCC